MVKVEFLEPERIEVGQAYFDGFMRDLPLFFDLLRVHLHDDVDIQSVVIVLDGQMPPQQPHRFPQVHQVCRATLVESVKEVDDDTGDGGAVSAAAEGDGADETGFSVEGAVDGGDTESLRVSGRVRMYDIPIISSAHIHIRNVRLTEHA